MVDVLRITIREYHLHLHRCDQGLRLLEPLLTEVTKALAKSTRYNPPGFRRSLNGSPPAQEPAGVGMSPGDRTTGTSKQANDPGQVLQKWFSDLLQPRKGLPEAPADWLELLKEVAGPEAAAKMHEDDTVWGMDVLGCIWQSDNWLQCIVIPALREPERESGSMKVWQNNTFATMEEDIEVAQSLKRVAAALQRLRADMRDPGRLLTSEALEQGLEKICELLEAAAELDPLVELQARPAVQTLHELQESDAEGPHILPPGLMYRLLLQLAVFAVHEELLPHAQEQIDAARLPRPSELPAAEVTDFVTLLAYLAKLAEAPPGQNRQTPVLRRVRRCLMRNGLKTNVLDLCNDGRASFHGYEPSSLTSDWLDRRLGAFETILGAFEEHKGCMDAAEHIGAWRKHMEVNRLSLAEVTVTVEERLDESAAIARETEEDALPVHREPVVTLADARKQSIITVVPSPRSFGAVLLKQGGSSRFLNSRSDDLGSKPEGLGQAAGASAGRDVLLLEALLDSANKELMSIWEQRRNLEAENTKLRMELEIFAEEAVLSEETILDLQRTTDQLTQSLMQTQDSLQSTREAAMFVEQNARGASGEEPLARAGSTRSWDEAELQAVREEAERAELQAVREEAQRLGLTEVIKSGSQKPRRTAKVTADVPDPADWDLSAAQGLGNVATAESTERSNGPDGRKGERVGGSRSRLGLPAAPQRLLVLTRDEAIQTVSGSLMHHLLVQLAVYAAEEHLVPHVLAVVKEGKLPRPSADAAAMAGCSALLSYLEQLVEQPSKQHPQTAYLRKIRRCLMNDGVENNVLQNCRDALSSVSPQTPRHEKLEVAEVSTWLEAYHTLLYAFEENDACAAASSRLSEWKKLLDNGQPDEMQAAVQLIERGATRARAAGDLQGSSRRPPLRRRSESMIRSRCADEKDPLDDLLKKRKASREEAAPEVRLLESLLDSANQELLAIWEQRRLLEAENMALRLDLEALAEEASLARATIETMNSIAEEDEEEQFETATSTTRWEEPPDHGITETPTPCSRKPGNEALKASKAAPLSMPHASSIPGTPPRNEPVVVASRDLELSAAESDTCKQTRIGIEHMRHGKLAEARIAFEAAVASSSDGDAEGLAARGHLAGVLYQLGDFDEAEKHLEVVLAAEEGRLGSDDPSVLRTRQNLANVYSGQGKLQMAQEICEAVAKRQEERLGKDHPDTVTTLCSLAGLLYEMGEMSAALEAYEDLLPRMSNLMGEEHPNTRTIKNNLAGVLWQQMDLAGARRLYEEVLASDQKLLGDDHPDTLTTCSNMAGVLGDMGDHIGAAELYETVLAKQNKILGPDHPSTQITRQNLQIELQHQPVVQNLCLPPPATATDILAVS